jgi:hypothetical protein
MDARLAGEAGTSSLLASVGAMANRRVREQVSRRAPSRAAWRAARGDDGQRESRWVRVAGRRRRA